MIKFLINYLIRHRQIFLIVLFSVSVFLVFRPIFFDKVIVNDFALFHQYPVLSFYESAWHNEGHIPLWSPLYLSGFPIYLGQFFLIFPIILLKFLNVIPTFEILTFLGFFMGLVLSYLFFRALRLSVEASIVGAFVYIFSQLYLYLGSLMAFSFFIPILPLLFLAVLKASQSKWRLIIFGIIAIGFAWYSSFSEFVIFSMGAILFFGLYLDLIDYKSKLNLPLFKKFNGTMGALVLVIGGLILGLPRIISIAGFVGVSARAFGALGMTSFLGIGDFINYFFPYFRLRDYGVVPFYQNGGLNLYVGFLPMILGVIAIIKSKTLFLRFRWIFCFIILFLIPFLSIIKFTYVFDIIQKLTLGKIGGSWKILFIGNFSLAILAGAGLDYLTRLGIPSFFKKASLWVKGFLALFITVIVGITATFLFYGDFILSRLKLFFDSRVYNSSFSQPVGHYYKMIESAFADAKNMFSFSNYHFVISVLFIIIPCVFLILFFKGKINNNLFKKIIAFSVVANTVLIWQGYYSLASKDFVTMPPKTAVYLKQNSDASFRIFRFWPGLADYSVFGLDAYDSDSTSELYKELLTPNLNMLYGVESIEGDENFMAYRQSRVLAALGSFRSPQNDDKNWSKQKSTIDNKLSIFQSLPLRNLISMMNVRYVLSSFSLNPPFKKVYETKTPKGIPIAVYENPDFLPRIYFAQNVKFISSDEKNAFNELFKNQSFKKTTLIECGLPDCYLMKNKSSSEDSIKIEKSSSDYLKISTHNQYPRWLVYSESNLPKWEVSIMNKDGIKTVPVFMANYLYQAIYIPAGDNEIVFSYPGIIKQTEFSVQKLLGQ